MPGHARARVRWSAAGLLLCGLIGCAANGGGNTGTRATRGTASTAAGGTALANGITAGATAAGTPASTPAAPSGTQAGSASNPTAPAPPPIAAGCEPSALDQTGCLCNKPGDTRPCYSADPATRNVGACKDGIQTCNAGTPGIEFSDKWGPCKEQVVPTTCTAQLDARCVGKVGCADEQCADKLGCQKDAGMPDAGNPKCHTVMGFGQGFGLFPDGGMWCEI